MIREHELPEEEIEGLSVDIPFDETDLESLEETLEETDGFLLLITIKNGG